VFLDFRSQSDQFSPFSLEKPLPVLYLVCVFLGSLFRSCLQVDIQLEIIVMLERCYASYKYDKYFDVSKTRYSILAIFLLVTFQVVHSLVIKGPIDLSMVDKINQTFSISCSDTVIANGHNNYLFILAHRITILVVMDLICLASGCINFLVNRFRLRNMLWYTRPSST